MRWFGAFLRDEDGTTAVEYAVMLALILLAVISSVSLMGQDTKWSLSTTNNTLQSAGFGS